MHCYAFPFCVFLLLRLMQNVQGVMRLNEETHSIWHACAMKGHVHNAHVTDQSQSYDKAHTVQYCTGTSNAIVSL